MGAVSRLVTIGGVVLIALPIVAGIASIVGVDGVSPITDRAPSLVIFGILLFVVGVILREYSDW